jgi:dynein intermediate chain, cytosolic
MRSEKKMADRKAELERKKAKLEQLRAEKKRVEEEKKKEALAASAGRPATAVGMKDLRNEAEDLLKQLGIATSDSPEQPMRHELSDSDLVSSASLTTGSQEPIMMVKRSVPTLGISKVTQTNIPPRELVQYCKETQTVVCEDSAESSSNLLGEDADEVSESAPQPSKLAEAEPSANDTTHIEKLPPRVLTEDECKQVTIRTLVSL